jgi:RNA polymerase sigma factor (sigma-70 family)
VAAVRRGDDRAFEVLYARYRGRIGAHVQRLVGDHGRAEDIAQEVFISALRRLRQTDQPIHFKPWIYEIAKNACIDEFRRRGRGAREVSLELGDGDEDDQRTERLLAPAPSLEAAIEGKQRLEDLRGAFRGLSESHHRILVLRELEGLSYNQIGDRLGLTLPMVESTLFRARRRLVEEFAELESGRRCGRVQEWITAAEAGEQRPLGARERRQFTRHLSHCRDCRIAARRARLDGAQLRPERSAKRSSAGVGRGGVGFGRVQL